MRRGIAAHIVHIRGDRMTGRAEGFAYLIADGPEAGLRYRASDPSGLTMAMVGNPVRVTYHPDDQFARRDTDA